jgi:hypothetical protein
MYALGRTERYELSDRLMAPSRYRSLLDVVTGVVWRDSHKDGGRAQVAFLKTPEGIAYAAALLQEVDAFRATLHQWDTPTTA